MELLIRIRPTHGGYEVRFGDFAGTAIATRKVPPRQLVKWLCDLQPELLTWLICKLDNELLETDEHRATAVKEAQECGERQRLVGEGIALLRERDDDPGLTRTQPDEAEILHRNHNERKL